MSVIRVNLSKWENTIQTGQSIYSVHERDGVIEVRSLVSKVEVDEDPLCRFYDSVEELPHWVQEKLSVLSVMSTTEEIIDGVGIRISDKDFWVFK
jgi:hypothetical protein